MANRYVTPTRMTKRLLGKPPTMSSVDLPVTMVPTANAATNASTPMLIDNVVPRTNTATRTRIETSSTDMRISDA